MVTTVGVAGITGKLGLLIVDNLLKQPNVSIRGYCRDPTKLPQSIQSSPRVHVTKGDASDTAALRSFVKGTEVIICCYLGDNSLMVDGQKRLIDACEAEGVPRYLASDYSFDFTKLEYGQHPSKDAMKHVKEYLETKKTVNGVHVLIGAFMDTFWGRFLAIWNPKTVTLSFWGTGDEVWEMTTYANTAEFVAAIALDKNATGLQKFLGDRKSIRQIAGIFETVHGKKPRLENLGSLDDLRQTMLEKQKEDPADFFAYIPLLYIYYCSNGQTSLDVDPKESPYTGLKHVTFEDFLRTHATEEWASDP